jgi:hypothetical protein
MHDALAAESRGIPAVAVMTDRFEATARAVAELNGLPAYPYAVIEHPIANNTDEVLRAKAEAVIGRVIALLTQRGCE